MPRPKRANGEGCFVKLTDKKYRMRLQYGTLSNGNPRILTTTGTSKRECIEHMEAKKRLFAQASVESINIRKNTVSALCNLHFEADIQKKDYLKPKSADRRESTIRNQIEPYRLGRLQVATLTGADVEQHIEELINANLSVSSIKKAYDVVNSAYNWGISKKYLTDNPCREVSDTILNRLRKLQEKRSNDADVVVLSDDDIALIQQHTNSKMGLCAILLLATGLRIGELCALRWSDYHERTKSLAVDRTRFQAFNRNSKKYETSENIVKNAHAREIALNSEAILALKSLRQYSNEEYIILNERNKPTNPTIMIKSLNEHYRNIGVDEGITGAHVLRRTFATLRHNEGVSTADIAAYMGDEEATVLKHYIAIRKKIKRGTETINIVPLPTKK